MSQENSHIQIPKLILKNFHNEKNELYYYDFLEQKIKKGHAKTFYTGKGYYSECVETYLDKSVETHLGVLVDFLKKTNFQNGDKPPDDYEDVAYKYLYSLISRAPVLVEKVNENSVFFQFLSKTEQHSCVAHDTLEMAKGKGLLREYKVAFLINHTTEQFVLPVGGAVQYCEEALLCPISPWRGIVFNKKIKARKDQEILFFEISTVDEVININMEAIRQEQRRNKKYIVASEAEILKKLLYKLGLPVKRY